MADKFKASSGLPTSNEQRYHYDIYAILEGPQEVYLGHDVAVNVNLVETVKIAAPQGERDIEKCYLSPTKRRGIERRALINMDINGMLLGEKFGCGIPHTCGQQNCPICRIFGAMLPSEIEVEIPNVEQPVKRSPVTYVGRLTHGGGTAVQEQAPAEKQRAMHPSNLRREGESPMPFKREYNEPGLLYPIYNHALSVAQSEFNGAAYAFLQSLARLGAGNPKGMALFYSDVLTGALEPMLVVDKYLSPLGSRPVISPHITDVDEALKRFSILAHTVQGQEQKEIHIKHERFERWMGNEALKILQEWADLFVQDMLK
ncbi:MAG TPA: hypothetical protein VNK49_00600 [Anaerolineales bacterium]|nr:hypothetical protein [Anaerolineales bacterium]